MSPARQLLIVDDDPDYIAPIRAILESAGYAVDIALNPRDGFEMLRTKSYDLLLLDIMMGRGAEGVMFARKMRKDPVLREVPTLIITGLREQIAFLFPGEPVHPHLLPVDELMEKPVDPKLLLEKVATLLETAAKRRAGAASERA